MTGKRLAFVLTLIVTLAVPSAARAFTIGQGSLPGLAVDRAGTAYIAWSAPGSPASLQFCRLPRGARACDSRHAIAAPGTTSSRTFVALSSTRVYVVQYRYPLSGPDISGTYVFTSTNRGASFDAGQKIGSIPFFEVAQYWLGGSSLSGVTDAAPGGMHFQSVNLDGPSGTPPSAQLAGLDHPYRGTVGWIDAGGEVAVFTAGNDAAQFRRYNQFGPSNDASNWNPPVDLGVAAYPKLAWGSSGLFLLAGAADNSVFARRWNGTTFGPPVRVAGGAYTPSLHAFQDEAPVGRLHAVFAGGDAAGLHLNYTYSDGGTTWHTSRVATQSPPLGIAETRVATAADHIGVAVYRAGSEIRVTPVPGPAGLAPPLPVRQPRISVFNVSPRSFRAAKSGPPLKTKGKTPAKLSFKLDKGGRVKFMVTQKQKGVRKGKRCVKAPRKRRRGARSCKRTVTLGTLGTVSGKAGANKVGVTGRLKRKQLRPGLYKMISVNATGGKPIPFRILAPKKKRGR